MSMPAHPRSTMNVLKGSFFLLLFSMLIGPLALSAQPPARGGGPGGPGGGMAMGENLRQMLISPAALALNLADTLDVSQEQREALTALERTWTEAHGERIAELRSTLDALLGSEDQPRDPTAMRQRMQGGQAPLMELMQQMTPLREGREAMMRDVADILTASQFQMLRARLMPARPGGTPQGAAMTQRRGQMDAPQGARIQPQAQALALRGWMARTDQRLRRLEMQGRQLQRQLRQQQGANTGE